MRGSRTLGLILRFAPPVAYMGVVFWLSHLSRPPLPDLFWALGDKVLHALEYVPMGFLWSRAVGGAVLRGGGWGWGASVGFGLTDEVHQAFVPGREPSAADLGADAVGAALGALAWMAWSGRRRGRPARRGPKSGDAA